ncbi:hypothetical protein BGZ76_005671, partial [Entomortierella beljakovae]
TSVSTEQLSIEPNTSILAPNNSAAREHHELEVGDQSGLTRPLLRRRNAIRRSAADSYVRRRRSNIQEELSSRQSNENSHNERMSSEDSIQRDIESSNASLESDLSQESSSSQHLLSQDTTDDYYQTNTPIPLTRISTLEILPLSDSSPLFEASANVEEISSTGPTDTQSVAVPPRSRFVEAGLGDFDSDDGFNSDSSYDGDNFYNLRRGVTQVVDQESSGSGSDSDSDSDEETLCNPQEDELEPHLESEDELEPLLESEDDSLSTTSSNTIEMPELGVLRVTNPDILSSDEDSDNQPQSIADVQDQSSSTTAQNDSTQPIIPVAYEPLPVYAIQDPFFLPYSNEEPNTLETIEPTTQPTRPRYSNFTNYAVRELELKVEDLERKVKTLEKDNESLETKFESKSEEPTKVKAELEETIRAMDDI